MMVLNLLQAGQSVGISTESIMVGSFGVNAALLGLVYRGLASKIERNAEVTTDLVTQMAIFGTKLGDGNEGLIHEVGKLREKTHVHSTEIQITKHRHEEEDRRHGAIDRRES